MEVVAIVVAAGRGERLGADRPKQWLEIGGQSILERTLRAFEESDRVDAIVVVLPPDDEANPPAFLTRLAKPTSIVAGGVRRQDSVANGFALVDQATHIVVVHDAARPFVSQDLIARTIAAARESGAAIAALPARDTVKQARIANGHAVVDATLARDTIFLAQTPQAFRRDILRVAIALGQQVEATDEAALAERAGFVVRLVEGDPTNLKVTTPQDLELARCLVIGDTQDVGSIRTGTGYDLHRLVPGRRLVLGGVTIPFERGALGHSDADALSHAIIDAVLGAAGAGNIGHHFPDRDERWKNASSLDLLTRAMAIVNEAGFRVENVDATVILEQPRLAPHIEEMCQQLAGALGIDAGRVSVKGKTNEGVGEIGRGEAIAVHAAALVRRREPRASSPES